MLQVRGGGAAGESAATTGLAGGAGGGAQLRAHLLTCLLSHRHQTLPQERARSRTVRRVYLLHALVVPNMLRPRSATTYSHGTYVRRACKSSRRRARSVSAAAWPLDKLLNHPTKSSCELPPWGPPAVSAACPLVSPLVQRATTACIPKKGALLAPCSLLTVSPILQPLKHQGVVAARTGAPWWRCLD